MFDLSDFFSRNGFKGNSVAIAVAEQWRDTVIEWLNEELRIEGLEIEAARRWDNRHAAELALQETHDENGERLRRDERDDLDLDSESLGVFYEKAYVIEPELRDVLVRVNARLAEALERHDDTPLVYRLQGRLVRIARLATSEEPRAKDKILAIAEEALAMIEQRGRS